MSDWSDEIYAGFLREAPLYDRQTLNGAAGYAMHFWRWYCGVEDYQEEFTYQVFHGVLSYIKIDGLHVLPDSLVAAETSATTKNTPAGGA